MFSAAPWTAVLALLVIEVVIVVAVRIGLAAGQRVAARHHRSGRGLELSAPPSA